MNRRHFLMSSAGVLAAARRAMPSPNDTVRVACVGLRGRGKDHLKEYGRIANVEVAALCDIDESVLNKAASQFEKRPATYSDLRKLLEDKSIDVISIATPNHSHTLQTIWAIRPGKTCMSRSPARTICGKPSKLWRPRKVQPYCAAGKPKPLIAGDA